MSQFFTRAITGALLVIIITTSVLASPYSFIGLILVIHYMTLLEFYRLVRKDQVAPHVMEGALVSTIALASMGLVFNHVFHWPVLLINVSLISLIFIHELYRQAEDPFHNLSLTFFGMVYITVPLILFAGIAFLPLGQGLYRPSLILGYFLLLWASDTGAYIFGSLFGKHLLFESISPKKTWEGSFGGLISTVGTAYLVSLFMEEISQRDWLILSLIIVVMGTYGDLFKSLLKRSAGVKDSGKLLPGHGGFLDRFDSLIGSAPVAFSYVVLFVE